MTYRTNGFTLSPEAIIEGLENQVIPWARLERDGSACSALPPLSIPDFAARLQAFIDNTDAYVYYGDDTDDDDLYPACYIGANDTVGMPYPVEYFAPDDHRGILDFYLVFLHEISHWTRHPERLNRRRGTTVGTKSYALEELTAEPTAAFVMNRMGITVLQVADEAAYLARWQERLPMFGGDKACIALAVEQANQACDYLFSLQPSPGP